MPKIKKVTDDKIFRPQVNQESFVELDGIKIAMENPDLDGDGQTGGVEVLQRKFAGDVGISNVIQPSELAETLKTLNDDSLDEKTGMSNIDMNSRINIFERNGVLALDALVAMGYCPPECLGFTRQLKRLNVSLKGKGRDEFVRIIAGEREHKEGAGVFDKLKGMMPGK